MDEEGRYIFVPLLTGVLGQKLWLGSVYGPVRDKEKAQFYKECMVEAGIEVGKEATEKDLVWIGMDANSVLDEKLDMIMVGGEVREVEDRERKVARNGK